MFDLTGQSAYGPRGSRAVYGLLIACVAVFLVQQVADRWSGGWFSTLFGLSRAVFLRGAAWQLVTYIFLHGGVWHLLINMLLLVVFGREMESVLGTRRFLGVFFGCGVLAGVGWLLISGRGWSMCIGASGAVLGVAGAFAATFPDRRVTLLLFFVLPVTLTARAMAILFAAIDLLSLFAGDGRIAHAAHLAGGVAGYVYARRLRSGLTWKGRALWRRGGRPDLRVLHGEDPEPSSGEVDRILEKITQKGLNSLTRAERRVLDRAAGR